ncbi:uncharacterized protein LOC116841533 [Odontomachus brunneus]|uniref:uncharacterized protein LOC116841533 n=1 Tax=Odontomachus brunneus TaxID=486640 RepID=UPI0013F1E375|nr:uncharacterized protein LOC116841533 [Odontomachus brunneus]
MEYWTILLSIVTGTLGILYLFQKFNYFKRHNVTYMPLTHCIYGVLASILFRQMSFTHLLQKLYNFNPEAKYIGFYNITEPAILLRDPELMKDILVKNFDIFPNRSGFTDINDPLFSKNLFSLRGQKWRDVRTLLSPAFTSSKMKTMFSLMMECAVDFTKCLLKISADNSNINMKDVFAKYTNDVIATCAFGVKINSMKDSTNKFYVYGKDASNFDGIAGYKIFFSSTFPWLTRVFNLKIINDEVANFFKDLVKTTIDTRDARNITRPDMIQLMMDARGKREAEKKLSIEEMTAQAFVFFFGGFDTSSTAMSFIAQEIAINPDVQEKLRQEIDKVLENSNGEVTYEVINRLEYLDAVINETLRLYPPNFFLERVCVQDYELPPALPNEKPFTMKKGMNVWFPVYPLQRDEKYYDDPENFRPERFLDNNTYHNSPYFAPFGLGPRMCIANRFAILEIKVLLFHLLARCELKPCAKAKMPIKLSKSNFAMVPEGGLGILYLFQKFNYFKRHNVIHMPPTPIFGVMASIFFRQMSLTDLLQKIYNFKPDAKYIGFYSITEPAIFLRDPELMKDILVKNFSAFPNRLRFGDIHDPLFSKNLFSLRGQKWRDVRTLLSQAFTSSKMKTMFSLMMECTVDFTKCLLEISADNSNINIKDVFAKYTNDVITTCAFGIKINSMKDPTNKFYVYGKDASNIDGEIGYKIFFSLVFPWLTRVFGFTILSDKIINFLKDVVKTIIDTRDAENITRPDMIQLMMDARGKREAGKELDIEEMTAQAFVFFLGSFETISTAMSFIAQEIAANPDVQEKLRLEIDTALENSSDVTYEVINRLEYLDAVINETLRLYPSNFVLERVCEKDYELPPALPNEKPFTIKKGINVWFPMYPLQRDEKYYDDPDKFRPERFLDNNIYHNSPCFAPFGLGPRMCIAKRFSILQIKILLFHLLARCELKPCAKTKMPIKLSKSSFAMVPEGGFDLIIQRRNEFIMEYWTVLLSIVTGTLGILYLYQKFHYFKRHNVIHMPPTPIFGVMAPILFRQKSFVDLLQKLYNFKPDAKYIGCYSFFEPIIYLRDPELMKDILVKNFDTFPNRAGFGDIHDPLFSKNLFALNGQKWRDVRTLLSPAFTSSKMKMMFRLMTECAVDFTKSLSEISADKSDINMKDVFAKYTNDVIATCAFGIKINSMKDPTNKFYVYGKEATNFDGVTGYKMIFYGIFPWLTRTFKLTILSNKIANFFKDIVKTTIDTRDAENITRPDMIQLMMDVRGKRETGKELDIEEMTAQAFVFFLGGFETSSTAMSFIAYEIAINPDVQERLRLEIDTALENSNEVTYEVINRLEYLDAVINETLRLYPPNIILERVCVKDYELPPALPNEKPFTMKKGMNVWFPVYPLQRDEKYYDDPENFRPERFLDNNTYHNSPCFAPFGLGPRMCIANRFAILEIKVLLFHLLARCELKLCAKTKLPIKLSKSFSMAPEGGFWLNIRRRNRPSHVQG